MAGIPFTELKNKHAGEDIWVIASGPSAGLIDPMFFGYKVSIGVNRVWTRFKSTYLLVKEHQVLEGALDSGATVIASKWSCGGVGGRLQQAAREFYYFEHQNNGIEQVDLDVIGTDEIVVSYSTITSAMHAAAYLGAANIILVGHDCGYLDGKRNFEEYPAAILDHVPGFYNRFLAKIEPQSVAVRERLKDVYGCRVYSLNPFLNIGLEGHHYESASVA